MASIAEYVIVDAAACSPLHNRSGCSYCAAACAPGAVDLVSGTPAIAEQCFGCGRCAAVCPVGALEVKGFGEAADPAPRDGKIVLECARVPMDRAIRGAVHVPCLGGLTVVHLLTMRLAAGSAAVELVDRGWCAECPAGCGEAQPFQAALDKARDLLGRLGLPEAFLPRLQRALLPPALRDDSAARSGLSRRGLFRRLAASGSGTPNRTPAMPIPAEAAPVLRSHLRQVALLRRLSELYGLRPVERLLPAVSFSDKCGDTGACAAHCPTGALRRWQGETAQGLSFEPRHCLACGLCARACPDNALTIGEGAERASADRAVVTSHSLGRCRQCGAEVPGIDADGHCPRCRNGVGMLRTVVAATKTFLDEPQERECHEHA